MTEIQLQKLLNLQHLERKTQPSSVGFRTNRQGMSEKQRQRNIEKMCKLAYQNTSVGGINQL